MADKVQFELVSPEKLLLSEPVEMVVVPGVEGDFGVLPGHAPLVSTVRPGVIAVFAEGKVVTIGAWPASTPKSPSLPGTSTWVTSPENNSLPGETRSN